MIKALQLILSPGATWGKIVAAKKGILGVFLMCVLPLLVLTSLAEGYALTHWGERSNQIDLRITITKDLVMRLEIVQILVGIILVFVGAKIIQWIGDSFHFHPPLTRCITVTAYGLSPIFLARFFNCIPWMNSWASLGLGIATSIYVLYQGIGIVLEPEQTKGFGLYLLIAFAFTLLSVMAHMISLMVLQGKLPF